MTPEEIAALQKEAADNKKAADDARAEIEKLKAGGKKDEVKDDNDLADKARKDREEKDKKKHDDKKLEAALLFNMSKDKFIEEHKSILPSDMADIFAKADKEQYESLIDKANDTKASIIKTFFSVQANVDELLTPAHKRSLEDYLKLTREARQEKADQIWENVFEPAFQMLKRVKKAEELRNSENGFDSSSQDAKYKAKLTKFSENHYLGAKA